MKRLLGLSLGLALLAAVACTATSTAQGGGGYSDRPPGGQINVTYFYQELSPYGEWFPNPSYGWCWTPYDVSADWRPYSDGRWEYTDYGWSWASNEPYGWAAYHYGRWFFDDSYGWVWVPGTEWAPAWVAWRYSDDYVGWAPLPPTARWDDSAGLAFSDAGAIQSNEWCFVPRQQVLSVSIRLQLTSIARNGQVEVAIGRPVPRVRIVDVQAPDHGRGQPAGSGTIGFFRPKLQAMPVEQLPPPSVTTQRGAIPDAMMQRVRADKQRQLESDLNAERTRLAREQQNDLAARPVGPAVAEIQRRHAVEQQAFEANAARQRQVLVHRIDKQIVRPDKAGGPATPDQVSNPAKPDKADKAAKPDNPGKDKGKKKGGN